MAASANDFFDVVGFVSDEALPLLLATFSMTATFDSQFEEWESVNRNGVQTRGNKFTVKKPPRVNSGTGLTFNATSDGIYTDQYMTVVADQQRHSFVPISSDQLATYNPKTFLDSIGESQVNVIAEYIEAFNCQRAANTGFRFIGSPAVEPGQNLSYQQLTSGFAKAKTFGGSGLLSHVHLPLYETALITQSGLQQFTTKRNDEIAVNGEIGELQGNYKARFYQNSFLPTHISGTASLEGEIEISAVADSTATDPLTGETINTSTISLTNMTDTTATVVENDLLDIGAANGLHYLSYYGYQNTQQDVQCKVITGGTASGGDLDIVVYPRLTYDATDVSTDRNLPRDIVTGAAGDKVRIVKSHQKGVMFFDKHMKFVSPRLPNESPYPTGTKMDTETKISLRAYSGSVFGGNTHGFVVDNMFGSNGVPEGVVSIIFPLATS